MDITATRLPAPEKGWVLIRDNGNQVAIEGVKQWATFPELEAALRAKGLTASKTKVVRKVGKPGRPRIYTPEEYAEHRKEANRIYSATQRKTNPEKVAEKGRKYREANPEKQKAYRSASYEARKKRLAEDPEYRAKFNAYQREWRQKKAEGKE